jgi:flagellar motor switch protein FliN/FliY
MSDTAPGTDGSFAMTPKEAVGNALAPPEPPPAPASSGAAAPSFVRADDSSSARSLDLLHGVEMTVTVELGRTKMLLRDLLALQTGSVIELDRAAGSPVDVLINDNLLARGEVVVLDDEFGVRILDIVLADGQPARH